MNRIGFIIFIAFIFLLLDLYSYTAMTSIVNQPKYVRLFRFCYIGLSFMTYFVIIYLYVNFASGLNHLPRKEIFNFLSGFVFTMFITKLLFCSIMLLQDSTRLIAGGYNYLKSLFSESMPDENTFIPERRQFVTTLGTFVAGIPFFTMLYGITKGKYRFTVQKITLSFPDLPNGFDGLKIVQISDIHAGSFDNIEKVKAGIDKINSLNPDVFCFTGDLVNSEKEEIDPYIEIFSQIKSRYGKFAVLGNHDYYGTYDRNSALAEKSYFDDFFYKFKSMGFDLLNNENREIKIGKDIINIIGVENWGAGRWFPKRGDLDLATNGIAEGFNILMSHDPTHWDEKVKQYDKKIDLTLSGHTHGFQFGFQMPGFQWSPAKYRYKKWLGLYQENEKYLYINRGFGFLGFPGRVGMWPEITLIELKSATV